MIAEFLKGAWTVVKTFAVLWIILTFFVKWSNPCGEGYTSIPIPEKGTVCIQSTKWISSKESKNDSN